MSETNALTMRWIPVLLCNGRNDRLGILPVLKRAGEIHRIAASNPMDNVAIFRLLLAVLQWCRPEGSEAEMAVLKEGIPDQWLRNMLGTEEQPSEVFELLGPGNRFMQGPVSDSAGDRPVADLFQELPGGTNVAHFRHVRDYDYGVCPACAAIGLVRLPPFMMGKGRGKRPGINGDPPMYFIPLGPTLLQSLYFNLPLLRVADDAPCWLEQFHDLAPDEAVRFMTGLTWMSRRFRIDEQTFTAGNCIMCGEESETLAGRLLEMNLPYGPPGLSRAGSRWVDPHISYSEDGKPMKALDGEKDPCQAAGRCRKWLGTLASGDGYHWPSAVETAIGRSSDGSPWHLMVVEAPTRNDKSVEASVHHVKLGGDMQSLNGAFQGWDHIVSKLLDPQLRKKGKALASFKDRHPFRMVRHAERPLPASVRATMADRLPALEESAWEHARVSLASGTQLHRLVFPDGLSKVFVALDGMVSTVPGSPLKKRLAVIKLRGILKGEADRVTTESKTIAQEGESEVTDGAK